MSRLAKVRREREDTLRCTRCHDREFVLRSGPRFLEAARCPDCSSCAATCGGRGFTIQRNEAGHRVAVPCACRALHHRIELFNQAELPRRFLDATVESLQELTPSQSAAKLHMLRLWKGFRPGDRGVGLSGPVGVGKTHLMAGLVRILTLEQGVRCRFVEITHLLAEIKAGFQEGRGEAELVGPLASVPVLVIDELGKGMMTEWQLSVLDELISRRYNAAVSTFFTTNYPFSNATATPASARRKQEGFETLTLEERVGSRNASRLAEMCTWLRVEAPDYRRRPEGP